MLRNYFLTIARHLTKNKIFSFINILGLSMGMAACIIIGQYVRFHTSFDAYHSNSQNIFRIESETKINGVEVGKAINAPSLMGDALVEESPYVKKAARFFSLNYSNNSITYEQEERRIIMEQDGVYGGESTLFDLFDFDFVAGGASKFGEPQKAIMSLETAGKYFEDPQQAIGETFTMSGNNGIHDYELVGVLEDFPVNSHINFEVLLSFISIDNYTEARTHWGHNSMITYLLLADPTKTKEIEQSMARLYETHMKDKFMRAGYEFNYSLMALDELHLSTVNINDFVVGVDRKSIVIITLIAFVILVIAWINYMNLSLARTIERVKEMTIRKCMGSSMKQITGLFMLEALVMNTIALIIAYIITEFSLTYVKDITGLPIEALGEKTILLYMVALVLLGTVVIGFYPFALLRSMNIINTQKSVVSKYGGNLGKRGLVFFQFIITFLLIASTLTIFNQIQYMRNADLGIEIENILVIKAPPGEVHSDEREDVRQYNTFKTELLKQSFVKDIINAGEMPGEDISWGASLFEKNDNEENGVATSLVSMDVDFIKFFDIDLVAGRHLKKGDDPWTKGDVVINEELAYQLGFNKPEEAVGTELSGFYAPLVVRGVVENHHHTSLHNDYAPIAYIISSWMEYYFVKLQFDENTNAYGQQLNESLVIIEDEWANIFGDYPLNYSFLDQTFDLQYKEDIRFSKIAGGFSLLAIIIASLGLFGLTFFTVQQRTKEIGIRKVLGAGIQSLVGLLAKEYIVLVLIACLISAPLAWWGMEEWLSVYPFRISLGWWFVVVPVITILLLALLSILSKVWSTARTNPIESLRYE